MTARIRLYREDDLIEMVAAARESYLEIEPWMPWCHAEYSDEEGEHWIEATLDWHETRAAFEFAIVDDEGRLAGGCGINRINWDDGVANVGYWVRTSRAGRGLAAAAVAAVAEWAFLNTSLQRLEIIAALANQRSQRVAEKSGAHRDALLRKRTKVNGASSDAVLYSIVRPD